MAIQHSPVKQSLSVAESLGDKLADAVQATLAAWRTDETCRRLWARDANVWTGGDEARWLNWLDAVANSRAHAADLNEFGASLRREGVTHALLIGMGGSSLGPEVLAQVFGKQQGAPQLLVLDSTDPAQIAACKAQLDFQHTLFIVASKSGSTLEPDILCRYFLDRARNKLGTNAGSRFVAITDPGSQLETYAADNGFRRVFKGDPCIGGRYSVLSNFGMVPATVMGLNVATLLANAALMVQRCGPETPVDENPGVRLGAVLGTAAKLGRDKLTLLAAGKLAPFGAWVEQLVAESTGKHGCGIVPVDAEPIGSTAAYGDDRLFVHLRIEDEHEYDEAVAALVKAGQPVVTLTLAKPMQLGEEFFRWEMATAVAGAIMGVHPFDQPDVEAAKIQTKAVIAAYAQGQPLPQPAALLEHGSLRFYADDANVRQLQANGAGSTATSLVQALLAQLKAGDYFALLAYLNMSAAHRDVLQAIRSRVRDTRRVATCLGFGPRFLHSTGQLYKGGANNGVFLQITCDDASDIVVPGRAYSFGVVKSAQASGDLTVLTERGRRVLHVHLGADVAKGLNELRAAFDPA